MERDGYTGVLCALCVLYVVYPLSYFSESERGRVSPLASPRASVSSLRSLPSAIRAPIEFTPFELILFEFIPFDDIAAAVAVAVVAVAVVDVLCGSEV